MKLHIANKNYSSWSLRPWVLMRTLGVDFQEALHPFAMGGGPNGFEAFSPTGKVPCLVDGDLTVWDSLAISEYLAERHAAVWPQSAAARAWARCAAAEMHAGFTALRQVCSMNCGVRVQLHPESQALLANDLARLQRLWREGLQRFGGPSWRVLLSPRPMHFFARWPSGCRPMGWRWTRYAARMCRRCSICRPCASGMPRPCTSPGSSRAMRPMRTLMASCSATPGSRLARLC